MTHLMVVISAVNNSFNSSQHIYCTPSDQVITVLSSCLHDLTSHMPMLQDNLVQLMWYFVQGCQSLPFLVDDLIPVLSE